MEISQAIAQPSNPTIHTYHCLCNNLVLATTCTLSSLPKRGAPSLDHALILPSPPLPQHLLMSSNSDSDSDDDQQQPPTAGATPRDVTIAISLPHSAQPMIIRRSDGFEKRWLLRCGRCRLVVGYQLDSAQFEASREGQREDVMYILPGALRDTDEMEKGKMIADDDVAFGLNAEGG